MIPIQDRVNAHFSEMWETFDMGSTLNFLHSGSNLTNKILQTEKILDVGCGKNLFKPLFPNLIGIDPLRDEADFKVSIQDFQTSELFDVALCLGSIHFGTEEEIKPIITKVISFLKPTSRIYWRTPVTLTHQFQFLWTYEKHKSISAEMGFTVNDVKLDYIIQNNVNIHQRLYVEWIRNN